MAQPANYKTFNKTGRANDEDGDTSEHSAEIETKSSTVNRRKSSGGSEVTFNDRNRKNMASSASDTETDENESNYEHNLKHDDHASDPESEDESAASDAMVNNETRSTMQ